MEGLDAGAEDYLSKPFDVEELLARLRALSRRHRDTARVLLLPGGRLDLDSRQVRAGASSDGSVGGRSTAAAREHVAGVQLSERECSLLAALGGRPTRVFGRGELLGLVFGDAESEVVVDTYVHYLRRKLGRGVVRTVRGRGYQLGHL